MNPSFSTTFNLGDFVDYPNTQYYDNSQFYSNSSQVPITQSPQTSQNTHDESRNTKWEAAEDIALMSAWCMVSEDATRGKNQKKESFYTRVKKCYDETRAENPEKIGIRNENQMKGRVSRLHKNAQKWIAAYQEAYRRGRSGMSQNDIEREAHLIYEQDKIGKFLEYVVFNEVMCKHPKWNLLLSRDTTRTRHEYEKDKEEESGGSAKRSRTTEECDYSNPETPKSVGSTIQERPNGRDAAKKKGKGRAPNVSYTVNGRDYNMAYYLTDGIYPSWAAFVKSVTSPQQRKHKLFAKLQEAVRKDVERAFGVLQARFAFLRHPCLVWDKEMMGKVMNACIIIHNMIVEDERDTYLRYYDPSEFLNSSTEDVEHVQFSMDRIADLSRYMTNRAQLRNRETHNTLKNDLIEHVWQNRSTDDE